MFQRACFISSARDRLGRYQLDCKLVTAPKARACLYLNREQLCVPRHVSYGRLIRKLVRIHAFMPPRLRLALWLKPLSFLYKPPMIRSSNYHPTAFFRCWHRFVMMAYKARGGSYGTTLSTYLGFAILGPSADAPPHQRAIF